MLPGPPGTARTDAERGEGRHVPLRSARGRHHARLKRREIMPGAEALSVVHRHAPAVGPPGPAMACRGHRRPRGAPRCPRGNGRRPLRARPSPRWDGVAAHRDTDDDDLLHGHVSARVRGGARLRPGGRRRHPACDDGARGHTRLRGRRPLPLCDDAPGRDPRHLLLGGRRPRVRRSRSGGPRQDRRQACWRERWRPRRRRHARQRPYAGRRRNRPVADRLAARAEARRASRPPPRRHPQPPVLVAPRPAARRRVAPHRANTMEPDHPPAPPPAATGQDAPIRPAPPTTRHLPHRATARRTAARRRAIRPARRPPRSRRPPTPRPGATAAEHADGRTHGGWPPADAVVLASEGGSAVGCGSDRTERSFGRSVR